MEATLLRARTYSDTLRVRATQIYTIGTKGLSTKAIALGLEVLRNLGVHLPPNPSKIGAFLALQRIRRHLRTTSDAYILRLPRMEDPEKIFAVQILNIILTYALLVNETMLLCIAERLIALTLDYGITEGSSIGFALYGSLLCWYVPPQCQYLSSRIWP